MKPNSLILLFILCMGGLWRGSLTMGFDSPSQLGNQVAPDKCFGIEKWHSLSQTNCQSTLRNIVGSDETMSRMEQVLREQFEEERDNFRSLRLLLEDVNGLVDIWDKFPQEYVLERLEHCFYDLEMCVKAMRQDGDFLNKIATLGLYIKHNGVNDKSWELYKDIEYSLTFADSWIPIRTFEKKSVINGIRNAMLFAK